MAEPPTPQDFAALSLESQKQISIDFLGLNQLYVPYTEWGDSRFACSPQQIPLSENFYGLDTNQFSLTQALCKIPRRSFVTIIPPFLYGIAGPHSATRPKSYRKQLRCGALSHG